MSSKMPSNPEERKRLLQAFVDLPPQEKEMFYQSLGHLRWLMMLWDLEVPDPNSLPSVPEKQHILLAYKLLGIAWFDELPELNNQAFAIYVRNRLPEDQGPEAINQAFDSSTEELESLCREMPRPGWLNNATSIRTSLESFPVKQAAH